MSIEKWIIRVDKTCPECHYHNKIETVSEVPIETIACGHCGEVFKSPEKRKGEK